MADTFRDSAPPARPRLDAAALRETARHAGREALLAGWSLADRSLGLRRHLAARCLDPARSLPAGARIVATGTTARPAAGLPALHPGDARSRDYAGRYRGWYPAPVDHRHAVLELDGASLHAGLGIHDSPAGIHGGNHCGGGVPDNPKYAPLQLLLRRLPAAARQDGGVLLCPAWHHNYYHWIVDILPRLSQLGPGEPLLVPSPLRGFQRQTLELLGLGERLVPLGGGITRVERLMVPGNLAPALDIAPQAAAWLRETLLPAARAAAPARAGSRRLYISRADAAIRRVENEAEVMECLRGFGFERLVPGELSLSAQLAAFAEAEMVVGPHGAAFANLAFCPPGAGVIEAFADGHFSPSYFRIAETLGLRYGFLVAGRQGANLRIDPAQLAALVRAMEAGGGVTTS